MRGGCVCVRVCERRGIRVCERRGCEGVYEEGM